MEYFDETMMNVPIAIHSMSLSDGKPKYDFLSEDNCSFKTYGGTEKLDNGVLKYFDTASVVMLYRPDIHNGDIIRNHLNSRTYQIISYPENVNNTGNYLKFKVQAYDGAIVEEGETRPDGINYGNLSDF